MTKPRHRRKRHFTRQRGAVRMLAAPVVLLAIVAAACTGTTNQTSSTSAGSTVAPGSTLPGSTVSGSTLPGTSASTTTRPSVPVPTYIDGNGFNDHSVPAIASVPEFFALSRTGVSQQSVVKFTIADMTFSPTISWMDSNFFTLHDEWYWFRLLNGFPVPGAAVTPMPGLQFQSVSAIYDWASARAPGTLPLDLAFVGSQSIGNRLYSNHFYNLALNFEPRTFGLGSLAYYPSSAGGAGERWVMELEYQDVPTPAEVERFFRMITTTVPAEIGDALEWVIRSPEQDRVATVMTAGNLPFHDRIVSYSELVEPGSVAVYNEGVAAGRLLIIGEGGKDISDAGPNDILLVENVPDWLPPGRALISSAPQTALAHVNLLARNRGIPNASQAGILQDAGIQQAARVRAPAIVRASAADGLEVVLITEDQYDDWRSLNSVQPISVPRVDVSSQPYVVDLAEITSIRSEADIGRWRPLVGGKVAGFINLMDAGGVSLPDSPLAITVRAYFEHITRIEGALDAMLSNSSFRDSARARYLTLEGAQAFVAFYRDPSDRDFAEAFVVANPAGTPVGDIVAAGGFQEYLRDVDLDSATLDAITAGLQEAYGGYALSQGLRFRSSSTVEDIEGFNGAGLYDSNTGFFRPDIQLDSKDHKKSIEWALKRTWASYWSFEAFEERRREGVDHRSGGMAVLVHARFDDPLELGNGVLTLTILPGIADDDYVMTVNAQDGAVSVTNPDLALGAVPEAIEVRQAGTATPRLLRVGDSNLVQPGVRILDDDQVLVLFGQARAVADLWRRRVNAPLPEAKRIETLTLDFEFKEMAAGWPAMQGSSSSRPARLVIKQARTLEPGLRGIPADVVDLPIPRDVLARARLVERISCRFGSEGTEVLIATAVEVLTDPLLVPDVGYGVEPYVIIEEGPFALIIPSDELCTREILYSTPDQFLIELLAGGELLNLSR